MVKSTINLNHDINMENYSKLRNFLKPKSEGFQLKKANTCSTEDINEFITEAFDER